MVSSRIFSFHVFLSKIKKNGVRRIMHHPRWISLRHTGPNFSAGFDIISKEAIVNVCFNVAWLSCAVLKTIVGDVCRHACSIILYHCSTPNAIERRNPRTNPYGSRYVFSTTFVLNRIQYGVINLFRTDSRSLQKITKLVKTQIMILGSWFKKKRIILEKT